MSAGAPRGYPRLSCSWSRAGAPLCEAPDSTWALRL